VTVFVIESQFLKASAFALAGAVLTFFGLIHSEAIGIGSSPAVAVSYLGIAAFLFGCARFAKVAPQMAAMPHAHRLSTEPAE
jgi:AGZA family xanthine/uracil permease-like MFS transporter